MAVIAVQAGKGAGMESRDSTLDAAGVRAALDVMPRITLLCRKGSNPFPCLPDEGQVWAEPRINQKDQ